MELVTGHAGTLHITAKQVSRLLRGVTATDESTVQRLNVGNNAAITYSGITMSIASGELLLDGYHVTLVDDTGGASGETLIFDATLESTNSRIDKVVLEIVQDNTTSYQRAEIVIVQGEESASPVAPATPTEPESSTEEFLAVGVIAQVTITGDDISSLSDLTNLYGGNYVEYTKFEDTISDLVNVYGAKNLLPYPYADTTKTQNGITWTDNGDGSITANGTATAITRFGLVTSTGMSFLEEGQTYTLNGCPSGGSSSTYTIYTQTVNNYDMGNGVTFTMESSMSGIAIAIFSGTTVSNLTFHPMVRLASIEDDTYEPYAMTNQELTKSVQDIESDISETQDMISDAWNSLKTYAAGEYCISDNKLYKCLIANTGTEPPNTTYWQETTCAEELGELNSNLTYNLIWTNPSPTANFVAQTLQLGDTYSEIEIEFVDVITNGTNPESGHLVTKHLVSGDISQISFIGTGGGNFFCRCRDAFFNGSAIVFSTGYMQGYGSSGIVSTGYSRADQMIPYKILARK